MFGIRPKADRRIRLLAAFAMLTGLFVTTLGYVTSGTSGAVAIGPGSTTGFEIEGNQADAANDPAIDWSSILNSSNLHIIDDPEPDNGIGTGAKENEPSGWGCHVGNPPKDDILKVAINERISQSAAYLDLADVRAAGTGDTHINFEFNQNPTSFDCPGGFTGRTDGDLLLLLEFPGNGTAAVDVYRWDNTPGDANPPVDDPEGDGAWIPDATLPIGIATGAENDAAIPAADNVLFGTGDIPERAFAEVSVNLGLILHEDPNSNVCHRFGSVSVRSRTSGESLESELKDIVGPTPINLSTCGGVRIHKTDDAGNPLAGAQFGLYSSAAAAATRSAANAVSTCTSLADGSCTFDEVAPGHYWIAEISAPAGYNIDPDIVETDVVFRTVTDVAAPFVDPRQVGYVRVNKVLHDATGATVTPPAGVLNGTTFLLYDDANGNDTYDAGEEVHTWPNGPVATCTLSGGATSCDMGPVATGDYRVTETVLPPNTTSAGDVDVTVTEGTAQAPVVVNYVNVLGSINIHLDKSGPDTANVGDVITYTFDVTTTGPRLHDIVLTDQDPICDAAPTYVSGDDGDGFLVVGETWHYTCQHTITVSDADPLVNHAQVTGTDDYGRNVSSTDTHTVDILHPDVTIVKDAVQTPVNAGADAQFSITVSVGGEVGSIARNVTVTDALPAGLTWTDNSDDCTVTAGTLSCSFGDLAYGQSRSVTVSAPTSIAVCGDIVNTATVAATNELPAQQGNNSDDATVHVRCPIEITIDKTGPALAHVGDVITYTMTVTNTGQVDLVTVDLTDPICNAGTLHVTDDGNGDSTLAVGETWTYTCDHTVLASDPDPLPNTATVVGHDAEDRSTTDSDDHVVDIIHPAITIVKTANPTSVEPGQTVTFTYVVTNTGDTTLFNVAVVDDVLGAIGTIPSLAPGESATLTKTMTAAADSPTRNVGTSTGSDVLGKQVSAQDDATITVVLPEVVERALPRTGQESVRLVVLGLALVLGGGLVLMLPGTTRRRREGEA